MFIQDYIGIAGIIGVGKTTLTTELGRKLDYKTAFEAVNGNPYLTDFYKDMDKYGAIMQIWLLNARLRQHKEFAAALSNGSIKGVVQDRTIWEDTIFAKMLYEQGRITQRDYNTYLDLFDNMIKDLVFPSVLVYLDCSVDTAMTRIKARGRAAEASITKEYITDLRDNYEQFVEQAKGAGMNVVRINWNKFQPVQWVIDNIEAHKLHENNFMRLVRPLRSISEK